MRKIASVRQVLEISPIPDAEMIERVKIDGWDCVVKKGEFKPGDKCIYCEIDSFLPPTDPFTFLEKGGRKKMLYEGKEVEGYRLRTVKLRGQVSQGLALPLSSFPNLSTTELGTDVTDILGILKYEAPIPACLSGEVKGAFPSFIPKTDEERIQNLSDYLTQFKNQKFTITEKVDGTSATYFKYQGVFGVCGRNWEYKETEANLYWRLAKKYDLEAKIPDGMAIQAEVIGESIQGNKLKIKGQELRVFYAYDITAGEYLSIPKMLEWVDQLGIKSVPMVDQIVLDHTMDQILAMANRKSLINPNSAAEGIVFRLEAPGPKVSFKAISNAYLLKNE